MGQFGDRNSGPNLATGTLEQLPCRYLKISEPRIRQFRYHFEVGRSEQRIYTRRLVPALRNRPQIKKYSSSASLKEVMLWRKVLWILHSKIPNEPCKRPIGSVQ